MGQQYSAIKCLDWLYDSHALWHNIMYCICDLTKVIGVGY